MSLANNHSGDYGTEAFAKMLDLLDTAGVRYFGGGRDLRSAQEPIIFDVKGKRIAILGYNLFFPRSFEALDDRPGIAWGEDDYVRAGIRRAREHFRADIVVTYPHWGWENEKTASINQVALAHLMIDSGADAVIEFAGNAQAATMAANMVRTQGRLVVAGGRIPRADGQGLYDPLYINAFTTHYAPPMFSPDPAGDWRRTMESMARQRFPLDRLMTHVSGLSRIQAAFEAAASGDNGRYIKGIVVSEDEQKGANE